MGRPCGCCQLKKRSRSIFAVCEGAPLITCSWRAHMDVTHMHLEKNLPSITGSLNSLWNQSCWRRERGGGHSFCPCSKPQNPECRDSLYSLFLPLSPSPIGRLVVCAAARGDHRWRYESSHRMHRESDHKHYRCQWRLDFFVSFLVRLPGANCEGHFRPRFCSLIVLELLSPLAAS